MFYKKKSRIPFYNRNQSKARGLGLSTLHFFFLTGDDMGCGGVGSKRGLHQHLLSESCFKRSNGSLTCRILCQVFSYIHSFWRFFRKWPRVLFHANLFFNANRARAFETWKQCQSIVRMLTCKHKIWSGWKLVIFHTLFKSLPCFQCSWNLQGIFIDDWSRDCQVCKKTHTNSNWNKIPKFTSKTKTGKNNKFYEYPKMWL